MNATGRVAMLLLIFGSIVSPASAETLVASNFTSGWVPSGVRTDVGFSSSVNGGFANTWVSQRFVPDDSGMVSAVELAIRENSPSRPLLVSLRADAGGDPGASFGEVSVPGSSVADEYFMLPAGTPLIRTRVDLSSLGVPIVAGTTYHLVLRAESPGGTSGQYSSHLMDPHAESYGFTYLHNRGGGAAWTSSFRGHEMPVAVFAIIPEPAAVLLALMMACGVASARTR